jgi:LytS/YehU family sensor histidine kinase
MCLTHYVPSFSLQTLVENAVRHAIGSRSEGGSISVRCRCDDGKLSVCVTDNGIGANIGASESLHFGLRSLRERLLAAFGGAAELSADYTLDGFEARFTIPLADDET